MTIGDSENASVGRVLRNRSEHVTVDNLEALLPRIHDAIMDARTHMPADLPNDGQGSPVDTYLARAVLGVLRADSPVHFGELFRLHRDIETANHALRTAADGLHEQNQTIAALRTERDEATAHEAQLREENARLLSATREEKAHLQSAIPKECPITHLPFFMLLPIQDDPNVWVPTYGGPFDSYTIPRPDKDGNWFRERFDHDAGAWVDGSEIVNVPGADVAQHAQDVVEKARHLRHTPMSLDAAVLISDELEELFKAVDALDGEDNASTA